MQKPTEQPDLIVADRLTLAGLPTALQSELSLDDRNTQFGS